MGSVLARSSPVVVQEHEGAAGGKSFLGEVGSRVFLFSPEATLCFASFPISNNLVSFHLKI